MCMERTVEFFEEFAACQQRSHLSDISLGPSFLFDVFQLKSSYGQTYRCLFTAFFSDKIESEERCS